MSAHRRLTKTLSFLFSIPFFLCLCVSWRRESFAGLCARSFFVLFFKALLGSIPKKKNEQNEKRYPFSRQATKPVDKAKKEELFYSTIALEKERKRFFPLSNIFKSQNVIIFSFHFVCVISKIVDSKNQVFFFFFFHLDFKNYDSKESFVVVFFSFLIFTFIANLWERTEKLFYIALQVDYMKKRFMLNIILVTKKEKKKKKECKITIEKNVLCTF